MRLCNTNCKYFIIIYLKTRGLLNRFYSIHLYQFVYNLIQRSMSYFNQNLGHYRSGSSSNHKNFDKQGKSVKKSQKNRQYLFIKKQGDKKTSQKCLSHSKLSSSSAKFKNKPPPKLKKDQRPFDSLNFANQYYGQRTCTDNNQKQSNIKINAKNKAYLQIQNQTNTKFHKKMKSDAQSTNEFRGNSQYQNKIMIQQTNVILDKQKKHGQKSSQLSISLIYKQRKRKDDPYYIKERLKKQIHNFKSLQKIHGYQLNRMLGKENHLNENEEHRLAKIQSIQKKELTNSILCLKDKLDQQLSRLKNCN